MDSLDLMESELNTLTLLKLSLDAGAHKESLLTSSTLAQDLSTLLEVDVLTLSTESLSEKIGDTLSKAKHLIKTKKKTILLTALTTTLLILGTSLLVWGKFNKKIEALPDDALTYPTDPISPQEETKIHQLTKDPNMGIIVKYVSGYTPTDSSDFQIKKGRVVRVLFDHLENTLHQLLSLNAQSKDLLPHLVAMNKLKLLDFFDDAQEIDKIKESSEYLEFLKDKPIEYDKTNLDPMELRFKVGSFKYLVKRITQEQEALEFRLKEIEWFLRKPSIYADYRYPQKTLAFIKELKSALSVLQKKGQSAQEMYDYMCSLKPSTLMA